MGLYTSDDKEHKSRWRLTLVLTLLIAIGNQEVHLRKILVLTLQSNETTLSVCLVAVKAYSVLYFFNSKADKSLIKYSRVFLSYDFLKSDFDNFARHCIRNFMLYEVDCMVNFFDLHYTEIRQSDKMALFCLKIQDV